MADVVQCKHRRGGFQNLHDNSCSPFLRQQQALPVLAGTEIDIALERESYSEAGG